MNVEKPALPTEPTELTEIDPDLERREALKRLGRYAAYTPPAVLTLLASRKALAADSLAGGGSPGPGEEP